MSTPSELVAANREEGVGGAAAIPSYLIAASAHSSLNSAVAGEDSNIFDSAADLITKGIPLSIAAGTNEIYNTLPTIGNWLDKATGGSGEAYQQSDFGQKVAEYDSNLSMYYQDHKLGVDAMGFMLGSMVPGMAGVKVLNAGQKVLQTAISEGKMGKLTGAALGILAPNRQANIDAAVKTIRDTGNIFAVTEANTLKALASGVQQNALEGAIFTTFVNATMFNSPVLEGRDRDDLVWDVAIGAALGGAIGGVFSAVSTISRVKRAGATAEKELAPWSINDAPTPNMTASDRILFRAQQLDEIPALPTEGDLVQRATATADKTRSKLMNDIRGDFQELAGGDRELANSLFDAFKVNNLGGNRNNLLNAQNTARLDYVTSTELQLREIRKKLKDTGNDISKLTPEEKNLYDNTQISYVKLRGENMGMISDERPAVLNLADKMKPGDVISLDAKGVRVGGKLYPNTNNPYQPFNIMGATHYQVEARYAWAELSAPFSKEAIETIMIHADDLPLLQKAHKDGLEKIKVIPTNGAIGDAYIINGADEILNFLKQQKLSVAARLSARETQPTDIVTMVDKLKSYFGINFSIVDDTASNGFFTRIRNTLTKPDGKPTSVEGDVIAMTKNSLLHRSLAKNIATLKHEEGHSIFQSLLDSYGVSKQNLSGRLLLLAHEVAEVSKKQRPHLWKSTDPKLIQYRNDTHELFADAFSYFSKNPDKLAKYPEFNNFAGHLVRPIPQSVIDAVSKRITKPTNAEIAKIVDVEEQLLNGTVREGGYFARDLARKDYAAMQQFAGSRVLQKDVHSIPTFAKVLSTNTNVRGTTGIDVDAYAMLKAKAKLYESNASAISARVFGEELPSISDRALKTGGDSTATLLSFESANYGSRGSWSAYVGQRTHALIEKWKTGVSDTFNPILSKLVQDTNTAIEFSVLNEQLRNLPQGYKFVTQKNKDGSVIKFLQWSGGELQADAPSVIPIKSPVVADLVEQHIKVNGGNTNVIGLVRANEGLPNYRDPDVYYPIPRNPKDTPYFSFVIDDSVTGTGHSKMIYAANEKDLQTLTRQIQDANIPGLRVLTKGESEDYFKAQGQYEFERSLNDNYINTELRRRGISSSFLPVTDPKKIVNDFLDWHLRRAANTVREVVSHKYSRQMEVLRAGAESSLQAAKSKFGYISPLAYAENTVNNPASNTMKQMLDIQKIEEYPFWSTMNRQLDSVASRVLSNVGKLWNNTVHPDQLAEINNALKNAGYDGPYVGAELYEAMNGSVPRGILTSFIGKANGLIGSLALRMDPLNALNNAVGHAVLYGTESKAVLDAIRKGNSEAVGELAKLSQVVMPGTADSIFSPTKILANSFGRLRNQPELKEYYKRNGFITSIMDQYDQTLDQIAIRAGDNAKTLDERLASAINTARGIGNTGERITGNRMAEEFNRFLAADFMKQITDIAVKHNIMDEATALTYINTFVNRTQGNFLASQRPILFQGPVGQAIGLFQTYQFNLIQQLLRHVSDGNIKHAATMMGLQSSIYGINGLPGFNALNTHIVGSAGGNTNNTDLYQAIFSGAGKEAGEWLAYGALSNTFSLFHPDLKINMYSRGDVNPRSLTIVPTDPAKVPLVNASVRFFTNIKDGIDQTAMGASVWNTVLRSLEHNGVSRPLAGLAQILGGMTSPNGQVVATSNQGNLLMQHDLWSLSSGVRMLGGKPLDESMVQDQMFRVNTYRSYDAAKRKTLAEAIKTTIIGGGEPDEEQINKFASVYASTGGKQSEFSQFMARQYTNASMSQALQLKQKLENPHSQHLQRIMNDGSDNFSITN